MADQMSSNDDFEQKLKELGYTDAAMQNAQNSAPTTEAENAALSPTDTTDMDKLDAIRLQAAQAQPQALPANASPAPTNLGAAEEQQRAQASFQPEFPEPTPGPQTPAPQTSSSPAPAPMSATPTASQPSTPSNPLETNPELNDAALKEAQQKASLGTLFANLGSAGSSFAALAGGNKPEESYYENLAKQAQRPVEDIQARRQLFEKNVLIAGQMANVAIKRMNAEQQQQLNDPKSAPSQFIKSILAQQYSQQKDAKGNPINITKDPSWSNLSGEDALNFQKMIASQEHLQALRDQLMFKGQQAQTKVDTHASDKTNAATQKLSQQLNTFRGDTAAQRANEGLVNSDKAMALINSSPDLNNISPQQEALLRAEVAKIATGGAATAASTHDIQAKTLASKAAQFWQTVSGNPTGAQLGGFIQQNKDYLKHLNDVNHKYIDDKRQNILNDYKGQIPEDTYNDFLQRYVPNNRTHGEGGMVNRGSLNPNQPGATKESNTSTATETPLHTSVIQNGVTYNWNPDTGKYE